MSVLQLESHRPQDEYLCSAVLLSSPFVHWFPVTQSSCFTILSNVMHHSTNDV